MAATDDFGELSAMVRDLIAMMDAGGIKKLKLEYGDLKLSLKAGGPSAPARPANVVYVPAGDAQPASLTDAVIDVPSGHTITAPMIGTFYVAPAPNEPSFVSIGDEVAEGQTIGIIEAMKIMNEIAADRAGTVIEIVANDGATVEYGSPLIRIEPAGE